LGHRKVPHLGKVRGGSHHSSAFHGEVAAADLDVVVFFGGHGARDFHVVTEPFVFLHGHKRALLCLDPRIFAGDDSEAVDEIDVCAQIGDAVGNVHI